MLPVRKTQPLPPFFSAVFFFPPSATQPHLPLMDMVDMDIVVPGNRCNVSFKNIGSDMTSSLGLVGQRTCSVVNGKMIVSLINMAHKNIIIDLRSDFMKEIGLQNSITEA